MTVLLKSAPHGKFSWRSVAQMGGAPHQLAPIGERMWRIGAPPSTPYRRNVAQPAASGANRPHETLPANDHRVSR